ncbi:hypothetical protein KIN20_035730 [Parelaphostrongylus tenuis]|uniref:Uncharacterized protein n=1 Tax=Parelaphostrongylus tenuis TaxID=148309 RepID=A0AAD5WKS4_PARTN|nr:hypothetical protein KIN20_035730 [Parelaphostrongylus tenuis]
MASLLWMSFNASARHEQYLSNQFPREFVFQMLQNWDYRIFIFGYSRSWTHILELKIFVDNNDNLIPFITKKVVVVDPILHAPIYSSAIVPASDFIHGDKTIRIRTYDGYFYRTKDFTTYFNRKCPEIGNYMIYTDYSYDEWTARDLPTPELSLVKMSRRRWLNPFRFHRRMSYPHTFHRYLRHGVFRSWVRAMPGVLLNCGLMVAILYVIEYLLHLLEKIKSRRGIDRSHSAHSF